jgi:Cu(I)/Ag(I) efflux system periplasmic protein CusF
MRKLIHVAAISLALAASGVLAQAVPADGQVTKVDAAAGRITLKHGPIKNLDMDAMTMVFRVKDPAMLQAVKAGDHVRFEAERVDGAITLTKIEKVR